jgi:Cupin superfamily protein
MVLDRFARLIAPLTLERFVAEHWDQRSLLVTGDALRLDDIDFDLAGFRLAVQRSANDPTAVIKAQYVDRIGVDRELPAHHDQIDQLFAAGMTICFTNIERYAEPLARYIAALREELDYTGLITLNAYCSPDGGGFEMHFDIQSVFILHLEGEKAWRYSEAAAVPSPPINLLAEPFHMHEFRVQTGLDVDAPDPAALSETVLRRGDVLYLPAGAWHRTSAKGYSLALTLTLASLTPLELYLDLLKRELSKRTRWRASLPPAAKGVAVVPPILAECALDLPAALGTVPAEALLAAWRAGSTGVAAAPDTGSLDPRARVQPDDVLVSASPITTRTDPERAVLILSSFHGHTQDLTLPIDALPFARALGRHPRFTAKDAMGWCEDGYEWEEIEDTLSGLVFCGMLRKP